MAYYCWFCYGRNARASGPCAHCGHEIAPPPSATETERLIWATRHPDPDVAIISTRRLGQEGDRAAIPTLRELIDTPPDPYVAAEALRALLALSSVRAELVLLTRLAADGPVMLRHEARLALAAGGPGA